MTRSHRIELREAPYTGASLWAPMGFVCQDWETYHQALSRALVRRYDCARVRHRVELVHVDRGGSFRIEHANGSVAGVWRVSP